ncbi:MAG TPA: hypothetical protein VG672_08135 [Bryobacteraceae bacterium]|nr:hypothetical protein [Bryobacteraceae bacterium]
MHVYFPPDIAALINKRPTNGGYSSVEDVLCRALEAQDAEESWTDEERRAYRRISKKVSSRPSAGN